VPVLLDVGTGLFLWHHGQRLQHVRAVVVVHCLDEIPLNMSALLSTVSTSAAWKA
jgi:hypothetical protein